MKDKTEGRISLSSLSGIPIRKVRQAFVYLNARRFGLSIEKAKSCAIQWNKLLASCFTQSVVGELYNTSNVCNIGFPSERSGRELYATAHYSAYTIVSIALAKAYNRPVYVLVGQPPKDWEETLILSLSDAGVNGAVIRSDFSQLKRVKHAMAEDAIIISLIDVPWTRENISHRSYQSFSFGAGEIIASYSIFKLAKILKMEPTFILCEPSQDGFNVVHYGALSQSECFEKLLAAVYRAPEHFERFCELQQYYIGGHEVAEIATFQLGSQRYIVDSIRKKYWKLGENFSAHINEALASDASSESEVTQTVINQIFKLTGQRYDEVVYF
jgi:hypothetical protein